MNGQWEVWKVDLGGGREQHRQRRAEMNRSMAHSDADAGNARTKGAAPVCLLSALLQFLHREGYNGDKTESALAIPDRSLS